MDKLDKEHLIRKIKELPTLDLPTENSGAVWMNDVLMVIEEYYESIPKYRNLPDEFYRDCKG